mmetsp:Transcript_11229/g.43762  ORF Transcript_11229/g.43762 Transcript_11229/m.43762 type:complete len:226 (+) Transcript_11229:856-1533(+)
MEPERRLCIHTNAQVVLEYQCLALPHRSAARAVAVCGGVVVRRPRGVIAAVAAAASCAAAPPPLPPVVELHDLLGLLFRARRRRPRVLRRDVDLPSVQHSRVRLLDLHEQLGDEVVGETAAPAEDPREVVAGAQGQDADRGLRIDFDETLERLQDPRHRPVPAAHQHPHPGQVAELPESDFGIRLVQVDNLQRVEVFSQLVEQVAAQLPAAPAVDEHQQRYGVLG